MIGKKEKILKQRERESEKTTRNYDESPQVALLEKTKTILNAMTAVVITCAIYIINPQHYHHYNYHCGFLLRTKHGEQCSTMASDSAQRPV